MIVLNPPNGKNSISWRGVHYDSTSEILNTLVPKWNEGHAKDSLYEKYDNSPSSSRSWFGITGGSTQLFEYVLNGWPEGKERALAAFGKLKIPDMQHARPRLQRGEEGEELDIGAVYSGDLDRAWIQLKRTPTRPDTRYCIAVDVCGSASEDAKDMFWPGATAIAVASALIQAGKPVKLVVTFGTNNTFCGDGKEEPYKGQPYPYQSFFSIALKNYTELLTMDKVALSALTGYFRGVGFKAMFLQPWETNGSLGHPATYHHEEMRELLNLRPNEKLLYVSNVRTKEDAQQELQKFLTDEFELNPEDFI